MPFTRLEATNRISHLLLDLAAKLAALNGAGRNDASRIVERSLLPFFNALFGWKLVWLERVKKNHPAVDLGETGRVAIQITSQDDAAKIRETVAQARKYRISEDFPRVIILFLLPKIPGSRQKPDPAFEVWSVPELIQEITAVCDLPAIQRALAELEKELGVRGAPALQHLHTIPEPPTGFTGRRRDLDLLLGRDPAAGAHLTGLKGMGGIGKTALAYYLAREWAPLFPHARLLLDGRGTQPDPPSAAALLIRVITTFHPDAARTLPDDEARLKAIFTAVLRGKKVLLLLDNALDTAQAAPLIPPAGCALIVTSRRSFLLGNTPSHPVDSLPDDEAIALLRTFHPALTDPDAAKLARLCAGLPLALRLAGAHLALDATERHGTPDVTGYLARLQSGPLRHLDPAAEGAGEITITETLRLSEDALPPAKRAAWRRLGVFTVPFEARAAAAIAGADGEMLARFVSRSLLEREGSDRYKLHDLAADYARARLGEPALDELRMAHARYFAKVGYEADALFLKGDAVGGLALFDRERAQIEAAFAWLVAREDAVSAATVLLDLVDAVVYTGDLRFHPRQRIAWLEAQCAAARTAGDRKSEGNALGNLGLAHADLGDARKAIEFYERQLVIAREIRDRRGEGTALGNLGVAYKNLGDARKAIEFHEQALVVSREIGDRREEGNDLGNLGIAHADLGDARKAIEFYEQSLVVTREIGDRRGEGQDLGNLGLAHASLGDARKAIEFYKQQLVIVREIGDRRGEANALFNSALQFEKLGQRADARTPAEQAAKILTAIESPHAEKARQLADRLRG